MINYKVERGEIYMADLGSAIGSIQGGARPVVIISNPLNNKFAPTLNVLPITSQTKNNIPVHVNVGCESGLNMPSTILAEQVLTINKSQLTKLVGKCSGEKMREIARAIILQINLQSEMQAV